MGALVNIIHPYTYKLKDDTFIIGPIEENEERDKKVASFVKQALKSGAHVLHHRNEHPRTIDGAMHDVSFHLDPHFKFLADLDYVVTTKYGAPLPDKRNGKISADVWNLMEKLYTSHSQLKEKIGTPEIAFFIGGVFENCLVNAAGYHHDHYRPPRQQLFYIPELCVSFDEKLRAEMAGKLSQRNIEPVSCQQALDLCR